MDPSDRESLLRRAVMDLYGAAAAIETDLYWYSDHEKERLGKLIVACRVEAERFAAELSRIEASRIRRLVPKAPKPPPEGR